MGTLKHMGVLMDATRVKVRHREPMRIDENQFRQRLIEEVDIREIRLGGAVARPFNQRAAFASQAILHTILCLAVSVAAVGFDDSVRNRVRF